MITSNEEEGCAVEPSVAASWVNIHNTPSAYYHDVEVVSDGYIAVGETSYGDLNAIIAKYDLNGNQIWKKTFGGTNPDGFAAVTVTSDGNIVAVGDSSSNDGDLAGVNVNTSHGDGIIFVVKD